VSDGADQALNVLYLVGVLVLVGSSLLVRRTPLGRTLKMAGTWVLIFAAVFIVVAMKDDFAALGRHVLHRSRGDAIAGQGGELRVPKAEDGHFWVAAKVNGEDVRFLIDSGATTTSLSAATAARAGVEASGGFPVAVETANGVVKAQRGEIGRLEVGPIERRNLPVHVAEAFGDMNVLGMNFLSSLRGWSVDGGTLVLKP
jgi:aspartyl protease family protein